MSLYPNLEAEMARNSVAQKDLAELLGKDPATICNWMNGKSGDFPVTAAFQVKSELFPNLAVDYLFERRTA